MARLRAILETDREWSAFALADLAPEYAPHAQWHVADGPALILIYRAFHPPLLFALGTPRHLEPFLPEVLVDPELYVSVRPAVLDLLGTAGYALSDVKPMHRMVLRPQRFPAPEIAPAQPLLPADLDPLLRLYEDGAASGEAPPFFNESMLRHGIWSGIREHGALVAAAGTLVYAPDQGVAAIGNVYTRRDRRRRGLAFLTVAAVCAALLDRGIRTIVLNVAAANGPAIRVYERLGFVLHCEYLEARAARGR